jgi:hypothetical protein
MALAMRRHRTTRACDTAPSWAGTCRGTRPSPRWTRPWSAESTCCSTWCATCGMATGSSRRTGPSLVEPRCWTAATRSWTPPCSVGRRDGRTRRRPGRGAGTRLGPLGGAPQWLPLWEWPGGPPTSQWPRLEAGYSDDLGTADAGAAPPPNHCHRRSFRHALGVWALLWQLKVVVNGPIGYCRVNDANGVEGARKADVGEAVNKRRDLEGPVVADLGVPDRMRA